MIQKKIFFENAQNRSIRENKWFLAIFNFFSFTLVHQASRLSHFSTNFSKIIYLLKITQNASIREKKWSKSKFENFALPMGPWVPDLVIFCRFSKMKILSIFSTLAGWIWLILHIMIVLIVFNHLTTTNYLSGWRNYGKCGQLCVKKFKISIFDQFFDFECQNMMDITDYVGS